MVRRFLPLLFGVVVVACSGLKQSDPPAEDADAATLPSDLDAATDPRDAATATDGARLRDASSADAADAGNGDSPADTACALATDAWSKPTKANAACANRKAMQLEPWTASGTPLFARSLSIARTKAGRVALAVNGETGVEEGSLRIRVFNPATATFTTALVSAGPGTFENVGAAVRIVAGNDDTFHVVYQKDLSEGGGPVVYRKLPTTNTLSPEQQVTSVGHGTHLDIAVSPTTSDVVVSYYVTPTTTVAGRIESVVRPDATQVFGTPSLVQGSFQRDGALGNGQHVLRFDSSGAVRMVYHISQSFASANPKYAELAGGLWRQPKTIDNLGLDGLAGYSPGFVMVGQTKYAAYHFRRSGNTTAELKIASWVAEADTPQYDVRDTGIRAQDPRATQYSSALAVDGFGLLHLAYVRPTSDTRCAIGYMRQSRKAGAVTWLDDGVTDNLPCDDYTGVLVGLAVDEKGRPHIGYAVAGQGLYYATRFDR